MTPFEQQVYFVLNQIPKGKVTTYGSVAKMAGFPDYARHVGKLLANLPADSTLPWFRVVNSQGRISLKGSDLDRQKAHLLNDGVQVSFEGKVKLKLYLWRPE
ncbi:MGMT family protein [Vibrio algicola]|uniref:Methylated-DNA-[protein]-cysteine S-methyltransferase DNA binding domain-containing protein n=1 Tax=Vibrio algicola TaxID=2662262 RepID=A0A5Q0TBZ7_9VIBR|nr:MGMT family protein [Vibrio algicola]